MIVLDTHAWIWWVDVSSELSSEATTAIEDAATVYLSAWSCWELATLTRRGRLTLGRPAARWIADAHATGRYEVVSVDQRIATLAGELPEDFPGDPSDRVIYATAVTQAAPLVTRDQAIRSFDPARTIW